LRAATEVADTEYKKIFTLCIYHIQIFIHLDKAQAIYFHQKLI